MLPCLVIMMSKHWVALASAFVVGTLGSLIAAFMYNRHKKKLFNMLTDYVLIGHVSGLNIFPVKSMKGVRFFCFDINKQ